MAQKLEDVGWHAKLKQHLASFQSEAKKNLKRDQNEIQSWKAEDKKDKTEKSRKELKREKKRKKKSESSDEACGIKQGWSSISQVFVEKEEMYGNDLSCETSQTVFPSFFPSSSSAHLNLIFRACRP